MSADDEKLTRNYNSPTPFSVNTVQFDNDEVLQSSEVSDRRDGLGSPAATEGPHDGRGSEESSGSVFTRHRAARQIHAALQ